LNSNEDIRVDLIQWSVVNFLIPIFFVFRSNKIRTSKWQ
jgi:hypothetical protein